MCKTLFHLKIRFVENTGIRETNFGQNWEASGHTSTYYSASGTLPCHKNTDMEQPQKLKDGFKFNFFLLRHLNIVMSSVWLRQTWLAYKIETRISEPNVTCWYGKPVKFTYTAFGKSR